MNYIKAIVQELTPTGAKIKLRFGTVIETVHKGLRKGQAIQVAIQGNRVVSVLTNEEVQGEDTMYEAAPEVEPNWVLEAATCGQTPSQAEE